MPRVNRKTLTLSLICLGLVSPTLVLRAQDEAASPPPVAAANADSPFVVEPNTPAELFDAVVLSMRLARPQLAVAYLRKFMAANPSEDLLLQLREKHGPAIFLKFSNTEALQPFSIQLLNRVNAAFRKQAEDPRRIDGLIADLNGTPRERETALIALRGGGASVVPRLLQKMGRPQTKAERDLLLYTLTRLGEEVVAPLIGALEASDPDFRATVIEALGWLRSAQAIPYLWYPAFDTSQPPGVQTSAREALARIKKKPAEQIQRVSPFGVARELERLATEHFQNTAIWPMNSEGQVELWYWDQAKATVAKTPVTSAAASRFVGMRLARQALALAPKNSTLQALFIGFALDDAVAQAQGQFPLPAGPDTAHDLALVAGPDVVSAALTLSLTSRNHSAALGAIDALSQIGARHQLRLTDGQRSPIQAALSYPDRRVQLAAAAAILQLDPDTPFAGSARVVHILGRALQDDGAKTCLVVDGNSERGQRMGQLIANTAYQMRIAGTGRDAFRTAAERTDIELIVIHLNISRWALSQTIANLRADARTAAIPILIYGPHEMRGRLTSLLRRDRSLGWLPDSQTAANLKPDLDAFMAQITGPELTAKQRLGQQTTAAFWLAHISNRNRGRVFDIRPVQQALFTATNNAQLVDDALTALAAVPTAATQKRFQELAVQNSRDARVRQAAAIQLAFHIQRFGLLLDDREVAALHAAWQTAKSPQVATALASVIGSLKPNSQLVDQRLNAFPLRRTPQP